MKISRHAEQRMVERLGVPRGKAQRQLIEKVQSKGATMHNAELPKPLAGFIKRKSSHYLDKSVYHRIYQENIFLFSKRTRTVITVLTLDKEPGLKKMCGEIKKNSKWR